MGKVSVSVSVSGDLREMMLLVMSLVMVVGAEREMTITKAMYDSMSQLVGEEEYPGGWWEEKNCTLQPGIEMAIWEPCNYVSNLAYDRLVVELCSQTDWVMPLDTLNHIRETFAILTFGSSFMHGSETHLGARQDVMSNDLLAFILHQTLLASVPYDPI